MDRRERFAHWLFDIISPTEFAQGQPHGGANMVTDSGWRGSASLHDRDQADIQAQYENSLNAWRKNPMAWRIVQITTDYTVGEGISISSPNKDMQHFIEKFWLHPENNIHLRLESMSEELARSGDLFPILFRQRHTGLSLIRFITKDQIHSIETKKNDWERETAILQKTEDPIKPKRWVTPHNSRAGRYKAVALHYNINRPIGAMFGESDLATVLPWLQRYSRMLEDRVRFHWATRMFLWIVKVPRNRVTEKSEQYRRPPESGSIVVHDESEEWQPMSPVVRGSDAAPDLKAVRNMLDAGSGYPPHWRGEATDVNLATAQAMQEPAERHLARRQQYFVWMLQDITYHAYQRAHQLRPQLWPQITEDRYQYLYTTNVPDVSRTDNQVLAQATNNLAAAFQSINEQYPDSDTLRKLLLKLLLKFSGEQQDDDTLQTIMDEAGDPVTHEQSPATPSTEEKPEEEKVKQNGHS